MANYDADEIECRCYLNGGLVANLMLRCLDSVEMVGSIMQVNYHDEVEEDNTGAESIRFEDIEPTRVEVRIAKFWRFNS